MIIFNYEITLLTLSHIFIYLHGVFIGGSLQSLQKIGPLGDSFVHFIPIFLYALENLLVLMNSLAKGTLICLDI
jgi:hypothetical protein